MLDWTPYFEENRQSWNARTPIHISSAFYNVPGFLAGDEVLKAPERSLLPDVQGQSLLHLQCHFGMDTLAWARQGALVTGLDFSEVAINKARSLAVEAGLKAEFVCANIYDGSKYLQASAFDVVFTSYGSICWLPDLMPWASLIHRSLKPGGQFVIVDFHPVLYLFDFQTHKLDYPYFPHQEPLIEEDEGTYADATSDVKVRDHFWSHSLSEIVTALLDSGLEISMFKEWDYSPYNCFPNLEQVGTDRFQYKPGKYVLPHLYGISCRKK